MAGWEAAEAGWEAADWVAAEDWAAWAGSEAAEPDIVGGTGCL